MLSVSKDGVTTYSLAYYYMIHLSTVHVYTETYGSCRGGVEKGCILNGGRPLLLKLTYDPSSSTNRTFLLAPLNHIIP